MPESKSFSLLDLKPALLSNLGDLGYRDMTMVQARSLPPAMAGSDLLVRARTGSGKTAAFGLALLQKLDESLFRVQALVLCPTRELADQVAREIRRLARAIPNVKVLTLCGGVPLGPQLASLERSPHIVVATPGRMLKHLKMGTVDLGKLQTLVLDEADRMLDMGFSDELDAILERVPAVRQTMLLSATYPAAIEAISQKVQRNPVVIDVTDDEQPVAITHYWCGVSREERTTALLRTLHAWGGELNLVFCNTKIDCDAVSRFLQNENIVALALHGDLDQARRNEILVRFANRSASVLIATDVAARGLDVKDVDAVFNYELPTQVEVYVHRVGRTGRAGKAGVAVSLVEDRELWRLRAIEEVLPGVLAHREIPGEKPVSAKLRPAMTTIQINGGRKNKLRPGDVLGALTAKGAVPGDVVGSIDLFDNCAYIAIKNDQAKAALLQLTNHPIKGRRYRARFRK